MSAIDADDGLGQESCNTPRMKINTKLVVDAGCSTDAGDNDANEDSLGVRIPDGLDLGLKGMTAVIADGVSAAEAGKQAADICVKGFLNDYYSSPEAWTTETAGIKVISSLNRWLYSLGQGYSSDGRGYVTTFSALVVKAMTAYVFHVGDSRIYRFRNGKLEMLTRDHSVKFGKGNVGLARAMGMDTKVEIDVKSIAIEPGDLFLLTTDGIHGFLDDSAIAAHLSKNDQNLDESCSELVELALKGGSNDNCSAVLVRIEQAGVASNEEVYKHFRRMPFPPELYPGMIIDGYEVVSELQATSRSQTYVVKDGDSGEEFVMKTPSVNYEDDNAYIERFTMEGWIGTKLKSDHLAASVKPARGQTFLYNLQEYVKGPTLEEWMKQNSNPDIRRVIEIAKQIISGVRGMHRQEMLHQDLKPANIIINEDRGAVIIDYGSTHVPSIQEIPTSFKREVALGTLSYSAPEYFLGRKPNRQSDLFSLGVVIYEMLTGKLPYGDSFEKCSCLRDFVALKYSPAMRYNRLIPNWLDGALKKSVQVSPTARYDSFSEFEYDLEFPNQKFLAADDLPLMERNPIVFWKIVAGALAVSQLGTFLWILLSR
ncbi:protein kinase [Puniceicoccaceae bacterium K14]|nr:protein kinase [Puniceicoccaceae bacterium K14]